MKRENGKGIGKVSFDEIQNEGIMKKRKRRELIELIEEI